MVDVTLLSANVTGAESWDDDNAAIAFICAMPMELVPLERMLSLTETETSGGPVHAGTLDGRPVVAIVTGMGTGPATEGTRRLLDAVAVRWVLVVGITGALRATRRSAHSYSPRSRQQRDR
jgi:nucleoside phosphorylase